MFFYNDKYYMRAAGSWRVKAMKESLKLAAASCTWRRDQIVL